MQFKLLLMQLKIKPKDANMQEKKYILFHLAYDSFQQTKCFSLYLMVITRQRATMWKA